MSYPSPLKVKEHDLSFVRSADEMAIRLVNNGQ